MLQIDSGRVSPQDRAPMAGNTGNDASGAAAATVVLVAVVVAVAGLQFRLMPGKE